MWRGVSLPQQKAPFASIFVKFKAHFSYKLGRSKIQGDKKGRNEALKHARNLNEHQGGMSGAGRMRQVSAGPSTQAAGAHRGLLASSAGHSGAGALHTEAVNNMT